MTASRLSAVEAPAALAPANINVLVWQAVRGATAKTRGEIATGIATTTDDNVVDELPFVWDALWRAAAGREASLSSRSPDVTRHLLDDVRRGLVDLVRAAERPLDGREILRVLDAIDRVQAGIDLNVRTNGSTAVPPGLEPLAQVAHDLRSPLTSILFLTDALRTGESGPLEPAQAQQLALIYAAAF